MREVRAPAALAVVSVWQTGAEGERGCGVANVWESEGAAAPMRCHLDPVCNRKAGSGTWLRVSVERNSRSKRNAECLCRCERARSGKATCKTATTVVAVSGRKSAALIATEFRKGNLQSP
jgi:hypothetical protein